jgi:hypothetical protein
LAQQWQFSNTRIWKKPFYCTLLLVINKINISLTTLCLAGYHTFSPDVFIVIFEMTEVLHDGRESPGLMNAIHPTHTAVWTAQKEENNCLVQALCSSPLSKERQLMLCGLSQRKKNKFTDDRLLC